MTFTQNFDHKFLTTNNFLIKPFALESKHPRLQFGHNFSQFGFKISNLWRFQVKASMLSNFWILSGFAYEASGRFSHTHEALYIASFPELYIFILSPPTLKSLGWSASHNSRNVYLQKAQKSEALNLLLYISTLCLQKT